MPLVIADEVLQEAGLSEQEARIELACRLFDIGKLALFPASKLAGLTRTEMEGELIKRKMPIYRITEEYWAQELQSLKQLGYLDVEGRWVDHAGRK